MRTIRILSAVVVAAALAACSKGGGASGIEGTWHVDLKPMVDAQKPALMEMIRGQMAAMKQLDSLPPEQREQAIKMAEEQVPAEYRDLMHAMLKGEAEGAKAVEKMIEDKLKDAKATIQVKGDNTWTGEFSGMGEAEEKVAGTWTKDGDNFTFTTKTKNGQPASGDDAKSMTFTKKGDRLEGTIDGHPISLKR
jgi:hypothetical protein